MKSNLMGLSFCKPEKTLTDYGKYKQNRELYVYTTDDNKIRLVGMKTVGNQIHCLVESCVHDDLEKDFLPRYNQGSAIFEPTVIIQPTVSDPSKYKVVDIRVGYIHIPWIPFAIKAQREAANQHIYEKAGQVKAELQEIFKEPLVFRSVNNVKVY